MIGKQSFPKRREEGTKSTDRLPGRVSGGKGSCFTVTATLGTNDGKFEEQSEYEEEKNIFAVNVRRIAQE